MSLSARMVWGGTRDNCTRSDKSSYYSTKNEYQFWLLHPWHTWKGGKTCIQLHALQTSTDLTATKLSSRNREGMFQQDGAHAHTSKATIAWLDANTKHYIPPPNSPDLSPLENVWSIMATAVYADPELQSQQALKHRLRKAWKSISLSTLQNFIGSMSNRLKAVNKTMEIPFHSNSEHGRQHRLTLTFIGPLLCNFNGAVM